MSKIETMSILKVEKTTSFLYNIKMKIFLTTIIIICSTLSVFSQTVKCEDFGKTKKNQQVKIYTLKNKNGVEARLMDYGATLVSLKLPDRNGKFEDVVLGFDSIEGYEKYASNYFGCQLGRYGGRIEAAQFTLDGKKYKIDLNETRFNNHVHGGSEGFDKKIWKTSNLGKDDNSAFISFTVFSPDGDQGMPGNLTMTVKFTLTNQNELILEYNGTTDKPTVVNMTNHIYYNLYGEGKGSIVNHELTINGKLIAPHNKNLIPLGHYEEIKGTQFDFLLPKTIGSRIENPNEQMKINNGYSHNYILDKPEGSFGFAMRLYDPFSGRQMEMWTTEPALLFHSGNAIFDVVGKGGKIYRFRHGVVFEPQHLWNSPNEEKFHSTVLRPNETFKSKTLLKFSAQ